MIARYTRPEMGQIWTDDNRFKIWLEVETLALEAMVNLSEIPASCLLYTSPSPRDQRGSRMPSSA